MKRALLIGINYTGTQDALNGCVNDISNINKFLLENVGGYNSITVLTDDPKSQIKPTKQNMESNIKKFVTGCKSGDTLFFYYSGHGSTLRDNNGDESDGQDSVLVPLDYQKSGVIRDDWLFTNMVNCLPAGVLLWAFTDCCHSGTMLDLRYNYPLVDNNECKEDLSSKKTLSNVYYISGCKDEQTSAETYLNSKIQGALTWSFLDTVNTKKDLSWKELVHNIREKLKTKNLVQIPQFSTGLECDVESKWLFA